MRIAQVAPLVESVPPQQYGGTERIVSYLTEELVRQGHDVTLFASGDSVTAARLVPVCRRSLRLDDRCMDQIAHHVVLLEQVSQRAREFDVIHFHIDYLHFPVSRLFRFRAEPGRYLAFLGRICPEKRVDRAIEIAKRTGIPLKIAAKIDPVDKRYFKRVVEPLLRDCSTAEWVGEISDRQKDEFLGNAYALLFPIDWPEPFGLVMIEAMACGTPVIAYDGGAVSEVVEEGRTGFIVTELEDAIEVVRRVPDLSRARCRQVFEKRFTSTRMARDYVKVYIRIIDRRVKRMNECGQSSRRALTGVRAISPDIQSKKRKRNPR